jgi:hypothetical protein
MAYGNHYRAANLDDGVLVSEHENDIKYANSIIIDHKILWKELKLFSHFDNCQFKTICCTAVLSNMHIFREITGTKK